MTNANTSSKTCFKCGNVKPRAEFYKSSAMADGLLGKCKDCTKADVSAYRLANIEKIRKYDNQRANQPHRVLLANAQNRKWRAEDRRRTKCHNAVARAIRSGVLERQPCKCGSVKTLAHHESYDSPLVVRWFCQPCHKARHKQMRTEGLDP